MSNYEILIKKLSSASTCLIVVSKMQELEKVLSIYNKGNKIFAENKPQELVLKYNALPKDIEWHMIGHLQKNKVKLIAPFVRMIHSIDSFELAQTVNKYAELNHRKIEILLQIKLSKEESKQGFEYPTLIESLKCYSWASLAHISVRGIMGMGSLSDKEEVTRQEFRQLKKYFIDLKNMYFNNENFTEISMGMSNDYQIALEEGSTMLRLGSIIFQDK
ncbi:MAG: YggS family pyridoxal phosphate-dependent enzyme [Saprospiraceae bacterium]